MRSLIQETETAHTPESLAGQLRGEAGAVLLRSAMLDAARGRYSFVTARPFLTLRAQGSQCELISGESRRVQYGNPWRILDSLLGRYELLNEVDLPFPLGGCFGYWGYDLKNFVEPRLTRRAVNDLELPDSQVGFYDSLVVFDHQLGKAWIVATGLAVDGSRNEQRAREQLEFWQERLHSTVEMAGTDRRAVRERTPQPARPARRSGPTSSCQMVSGTLMETPFGNEAFAHGANLNSASKRPIQTATGNLEPVTSTVSRADFLAAVQRAQAYIRAGHIYQVNLSQRLAAACPLSGWELFQRLSEVSPAPFAAYLDCGDFQVASSSPELFLRLSGSQIQTRPIKGTRPRSADSDRDAQLTYELQTSAKEMAELVMITDLLRNDLGRVCEYGSVRVPELVRLERYAQVQHLVSTVEGRLRPEVTHLAALAACFPGGSITGAPKIRAMEIIDELEPTARGPYTGCLGYLGFNRESQLSITIRTALCRGSTAYFHVGAGIVADSVPEAEYEETLTKAQGFFAALNLPKPGSAGVLTRSRSANQPARDAAGSPSNCEQGRDGPPGRPRGNGQERAARPAVGPYLFNSDAKRNLQEDSLPSAAGEDVRAPGQF